MRLRGLLLHLLALVSAQALSSSFCDTEAHSSRCISWNKGSTVPGYYLNVTVNETPLEYVAVDTGSTGFLVAAKYFGYKDDSALKKCCEPAFQYLSSSRRYYQGYWLPSNLTFSAQDDHKIHARIPVLAITERGKCTSFENGHCTKANATYMPSGTKYMGVGFGRRSTEQPNATASTNPLLNVDFPPQTSLTPGYILSNQGLILGLSPDDLTDNSWSPTHLSRQSILNTDMIINPVLPEWTGTPVCISLAAAHHNNSNSHDFSEDDCTPGTVLFDTGIPHSYLGLPPTQTAPFRIHKPNSSAWILRDDTEVTVRIGRPGNYAFTYSFTVGEFGGTPDVTPKYVQLGKMHAGLAFLNTGRNFFAGFDLLFDEAGGRVGVRRNGVEVGVGLGGEGEELVREEL